MHLYNNNADLILVATTGRLFGLLENTKMISLREVAMVTGCDFKPRKWKELDHVYRKNGTSNYHTLHQPMLSIKAKDRGATCSI